MNAAEDMRLVWLRHDLAKAEAEIAKLRERLTQANEEIGGLRAELEWRRGRRP
jgi:predicted  nucleic acid-binding Zn-ribbon protein